MTAASGWEEEEAMLVIWEEDFSTRAFRLEKEILEMEKLAEVKFTLPGSLRGKFPPDLKIRITPGSPPPPDYFHCGPMRVVSEDLMGLLLAWPVTEAEFFPVQVFQKDKPADRNYFCFHVVVEVDCLDLERSEYTLYEGTEFVKSVKRLALDESKTDGHTLFRLARFYRTITCVQESLAGEIRKARLTGLTFINSQDWRWR